MVKKPRKNTTSASRRARSSSVFSVSSITTSVTPASRPSSVRCEAQVPASVMTSSTMSHQRPGSGRAVTASQPRHTSTPAASALAQIGKCATCGKITQPITASKNSVSRASRGRWARAVIGFFKRRPLVRMTKCPRSASMKK